MARLSHSGRSPRKVGLRAQSAAARSEAIIPTAGVSAGKKSGKTNHSKERDRRFSMAEFMGPIYQSFGKIDTDPCGDEQSPVQAKRRILLSKGGDGLAESWSGKTAYVNPPFSQQAKWLQYGHEQWLAGNVETVIFLAPTSTDVIYFQDVMSFDADLFLIRGRLKFISPDRKVRSTRYPLMLIALGTTEKQRAHYAELADGFWVKRLDSKQ